MVGAEVDMYTSVKNRIFSHDMRRAGMVHDGQKWMFFSHLVHKGLYNIPNEAKLGRNIV